MDQGSSSKSHSGQKQIGLPKWNPKHKIFLSHSGKQKEFARQLCKDLEAETHYPFFDERSSSLIKGENFAPLIFEAARQCLVAVIVLSKDFLTSKWPMLDLVEFIKAKRSHNPELKLFPLFYKLSPDDLKPECIESCWKAMWAKIIDQVPNEVTLQDDTHRELNLSLCKEALGELHSANGLKFENFPSEVAYREEIVKEISLLVTPELFDDTSDVIGNKRLCKTLAKMFIKDTSNHSNLYDTYKLGLYGMVGIGKTTMSRALCTFFYERFKGRVFHVELGSRHPLDLQKLVLTKLLKVNQDLVEKVHTMHQGQKLLKDYMNQKPVFLVIDNIIDDRQSRMEALAYLQAGFHSKSMIMITSRSLDVVEELFPKHLNVIYCKALAMLSEEEASLIFLQRAAPQRKLDTLTIQEEKILKSYLSQCHLLHDNKERQYNPMVIQLLASYCHNLDKNMLKWKGQCEDLDNSRLFSALSNIFVSWASQFTTLTMKDRLIFLDLCLYIDQYLLVKGSSKVLSWLVDIHEGEDTSKAMEFELRRLKRLGILNVILNEEGVESIAIHYLYREFAKWYVIDGEGSRSQKLGCIYHTISTNSLPYILKRTSPSSFQLQRILLENLKCAKFPSMKVQEWCNIVVLQIHKCSNLKVLDLHGLNCLCHLELVKLPSLESFYFAKLEANSNNVSNGTLESLRHVVLIFLRSLNQLPDFSQCTLLKTFRMLECEQFLLKPPQFIGCSQLEDLNLDWNRHWQVEEFKLDTLTSLTSLAIRNVKLMGASNWSTISLLKAVDFLTLKGLKKCTQLQTLILVALPITSLKGIEKLKKLQELQIKSCDSLQYIPDLSTFIKLRNLLIVGGLLKQIPGVEGLLQLKYLQISDNLKLKSLPNLDHLLELKYVHLLGCSLLKAQPQLPLGCWLVPKNT